MRVENTSFHMLHHHANASMAHGHLIRIVVQTHRRTVIPCTARTVIPCTVQLYSVQLSPVQCTVIHCLTQHGTLLSIVHLFANCA